MPEPMPRQYVGDAQFAALLHEVKCPMALHQVKAFVLGCLAASDVPKIDAILRTLWGGEIPAFDGVEQLERFTGHLFALWNELAGTTGSLRFPSSVAPDLQSLPDVARFAVLRQEEVIGFLRGLDAGNTRPERLTPEARRALEALGTALHLWSEFDRLISEKPTEGAESVGETVANLRQLDQVVGDAIGVVVSEQRRVRLQQTRPQGTSGAYVKTAAPGRNDPCPCGSGRKYKQCCGNH